MKAPHKGDSHFSIEELMRMPASPRAASPAGGLHLSSDTKRVALVAILALASFVTVYFLTASSSGDQVKTQIRFAGQGSETPAPDPQETPAPLPTSIAYNGFLTANGNANGLSSTVIRNTAPGNNANANGTLANANGVPGFPVGNANANGMALSPSPSPSMVAVPVPSARPVALGQGGVVGSEGGLAPMYTPTPSPSPSFSPSPSASPSASPTATPVMGPLPTPTPTPTPEPQKRETAASGPGAWMALVPLLMVGVFHLSRRPL